MEEGQGPTKTDIQNRQDIDRLLADFYHRLLADASIAFVFTDVAKIDLGGHLPIIGDFWEMILFQKDVYRKNTMQIHKDLNGLTRLTPALFKIWLGHFNQTVDDLFEGEKAFLAKQRALSIATSMMIKFKV